MSNEIDSQISAVFCDVHEFKSKLYATGNNKGLGLLSELTNGFFDNMKANQPVITQEHVVVKTNLDTIRVLLTPADLKSIEVNSKKCEKGIYFAVSDLTETPYFLDISDKNTRAWIPINPGSEMKLISELVVCIHDGRNFINSAGEKLNPQSSIEELAYCIRFNSAGKPLLPGLNLK